MSEVDYQRERTSAYFIGFPKRTPDGERTPSFLRGVHTSLSQRDAKRIDHGEWLKEAGVFDAVDLRLLRAAYEEACAFLGRTPSPVQRAEMARSIIMHARRGLCDPHRLAVKAVVSI